VSSRLLEYEVWTREHAGSWRGATAATCALVGRVALLELVSPALTRALELDIARPSRTT